MPFIFKGWQDPNTYVWSKSDFLQTLSDNKVKMEPIDKELRLNICGILNSVPEETINGIIGALKYAGLESLSDLKFVHEEDLILVLKPIQRRKLINAWREQSIASPKIPVTLPSQNCKWKKKKSLVLLEVYTKYKTDFSCPDLHRKKVWENIAHEVRKRCSSMNCSGLQCYSKIEELKEEYEKLKNKSVISNYDINFFYKAKLAFGEITENSGEDANKIGIYIPPHLRNGENWRASSNITNKTFTIKVENLSEGVTKSDLQELFKPFGTIARIYLIKYTSDQSKNYAFIKFHKEDDANRALSMNGLEYNNLTLKVEWAKSTEASELETAKD